MSTLAPWREQIVRWVADGIQGTTIHAALIRMRSGLCGCSLGDNTAST
ncbi:MAG: hypothetical protein IT479_00955 [Xanthomonadales bacterium]|nr:hypothetical protein [Xanthomonadales bacterium]